MKWGNLWRVLKVLAANAPMIIAVVEKLKQDPDAVPPR